ncbi:MAG: sulfatase [Halobacteria archaeon]|nr:sulfatase [Halobacteria archaeon]
MTNVVLLTVDSLRADHVGCYGYERDTTPFIDTLAYEGASFDAYANSTWTRASFPSILTSTYPLEYGGFEYLSDSRVTVGEAVSDQASTAAFHSNLWLSRDYNYDRGFDTFYDSKSDPTLLAKLRAYVKTNLDHDSRLYRILQWLYDTTEEKSGVDVGQTYKDAETMTDLTVDWISEQEDDFFVWTHYMDVHHPYVPHDTLGELGIDLNISEREAVKLRRKMLEEPDEISDDDLKTLIDLYDCEIRYVDNQIRRLYEHLEESGIADDTAVIFTSDHGEEFRDHGGFSHNDSMYDEVLHVPFVIHGTDARDISEDIPVELLDVPPTVCDIVGVENPPNYRGVSALENEGKRRHIISETNNPEGYKISVRTDEYKYIWDIGNEERELYNLAENPGETENMINSTEYEEVAQELHDELVEHLDKVKSTNEKLPDITMDNEVEERLEELGYLS